MSDMAIYQQFGATLFSQNMAVAPQSTLKAFLQGLAWALFVIAGLAILVAGSAISDFGKVDRALAEVVGDSTALLIAGLRLYPETHCRRPGRNRRFLRRQ